MTSHPYRSLPQKAFWRRSIERPEMSEVDPVGRFDLKITPEMRVATAGSCFAQHIARHLKRSGFNYYVGEKAHPILSPTVGRANNYGTFSARYGNIYTARQLCQLFDRCRLRFNPVEEPWIMPDGTVRDPFRPSIQPGNFISVDEMEADRAQHLFSVRMMLKKLDVFVFTLGLTECWESAEDGAVFPICPGVEGGTFDPDKYTFRNQTVPEVVEDMTEALRMLRGLNPKAQVVLTVSPVPLMASAAPDEHVLAATTYSKAVLRVAAQMLRDAHDFVHYFPSFEVITGNYNRGRYYADDLRNVTEEGVSHVMRLFLKHATTDGATTQKVAKKKPAPVQPNATLEAARAYVEVECDEVALDRE
ncbi:MAG: GSCFA domain-containing protein [Pseudomonadota bacterium]